MTTTSLVVEDGSGKTTSNSYVTAAEISQYAEDRAITLSGTYGDPTQIAYIAMDYLEARNFKGYKLTEAQALQWPRSGVEINDYPVDTDEIPVDLKNAQMAIAISIDQGFDPLPNVSRSQKRVKVDVIEVEYMDKATASPYATRIGVSLKSLVQAGNSGSNFRVTN